MPGTGSVCRKCCETNNWHVLAGTCSKGSKTQGLANRTRPLQLASSILTIPQSADSKSLPYLDNSSCSKAYISINKILDPFQEHKRGAFCLTRRLAGALHTSEKVMGGLPPWLPWMPGKGLHPPGFPEAEFLVVQIPGLLPSCPA